MSYYYSYMIDGPAKYGMGSPQFAGTEISLLGFHNFVCLHNTHVFMQEQLLLETTMVPVQYTTVILIAAEMNRT